MGKKIIKKALQVLFYIIIPLSLIAYLLFSVCTGGKKHTLYPGRDMWSGTFGDYQESGGKSIISRFDVTRERIVFTYTLKRGFINPYVGFAMGSRHGWINLKPFDELKIKIGSTHSRSMRVFMFTKIPGYTIENDFSTYLHLQKEIPVQKECLEYTVKLAALYTPEWWYERALSENDPALVRDFSRVYSVSIQSGINQPVDITDTVTVEEIRFHKSSHTLLGILIFMSIFYSGAVFSFFLLRHYKYRLAKKIDKVVRACRDIGVDHRFDEETERIITYIGENYCKCDLTVDAVSRACGIPVMKIPQCLKTYFDLSFPQYLNAIRLAEAKRLLKETDLMISEIAFQIGFNSIPHFNRVFKDNEKISPRDFRKK
jgi:AraC-like DNA-binding protein